MNALRTYHPLSKWRFTSVIGSYWRRVNTVSGNGCCRNLAFYSKTSLSNIDITSPMLRMVSKRGTVRPESQQSLCGRFFHMNHGGMEKWNDASDSGNDDKDGDKRAALMEKIEGQICEIIESVLEKTQENEVVGGNLADVLDYLVRHLYSMRISPLQIHQMLIDNKEISRHQHFIPITQFLYKNGLNGRRTCRLVAKYPEILDIPKDVIREKIENLRELGFITSDILLVLEGFPAVLQIPEKNLKRRISDLELLFKSKDVLDLIVKSPTVLTDDPETIQEKFDYVFHEMGITQRQMMYSSLFRHSLRYIRQRHVFLVRAGYFKKVLKKGQINPNPILEDIIDISTRAFLKKYGNMTMSDYMAFCELFERECNEIQDNMKEYSDDEETHVWKR